MTHHIQGEYFAECEWCSEPTCYEPQWCAKSQKPQNDGKVFESVPIDATASPTTDVAFWVPQERF